MDATDTNQKARFLSELSWRCLVLGVIIKLHCCYTKWNYWLRTAKWVLLCVQGSKVISPKSTYFWPYHGWTYDIKVELFPPLFWQSCESVGFKNLFQDAIRAPDREHPPAPSLKGSQTLVFSAFLFDMATESLFRLQPINSTHFLSIIFLD